eukprot:scaffold11133_cov74-Phaeocystis_antarctica.AAC.1
MQIFSDSTHNAQVVSGLSPSRSSAEVHSLRAALAARSARRSLGRLVQRDVDLDTRTELAHKCCIPPGRAARARARSSLLLSGSAVPTRHATANNITYFDAFTFNVTARGASQRGQPRRAPSRAVAEGCWSAVDGRGDRPG